MRDGDDVIMIAHATRKRVIDVSAQIGFRLPAFATSLGRVLLAALDDAALDQFLAARDAAQAHADDDGGQADAAQGDPQGAGGRFPFVDQEAEVGFRSISVPLRRLDGRVIASLNVGAYSERMPPKTMHSHFFPRLRAVTDELQRQLI